MSLEPRRECGRDPGAERLTHDGDLGRIDVVIDVQIVECPPRVYQNALFRRRRARGRIGEPSVPQKQSVRDTGISLEGIEVVSPVVDDEKVAIEGRNFLSYPDSVPDRARPCVPVKVQDGRVPRVPVGREPCCSDEKPLENETEEKKKVYLSAAAKTVSSR